MRSTSWRSRVASAGLNAPPQGNTVDDEEKRVEFAEPPNLGNRARRPVVAAWRDLDAGCKRERAFEIRGAAAAQFSAAKHFNGDGHVVRQFRRACRHHFHALTRPQDLSRRSLTLRGDRNRKCHRQCRRS